MIQKVNTACKSNQALQQPHTVRKSSWSNLLQSTLTLEYLWPQRYENGRRFHKR